MKVGEIVNIKKRPNKHKFYLKANKILSSNLNISIGSEIPINGDIFKIIERRSYDMILGEFLSTGGRRWTRNSEIKLKKVKDYMSPSACGVGYLGNEYDDVKLKFNKRFFLKVKNIWNHMLHRCYDVNSPRYNSYGSLVIRVHPDWHNFCNFINDIEELDGFNEGKLMAGEIQLDKDKCQIGLPKSKIIYAKDTCCFLTPDENTDYRHDIRTFIVIHPIKYNDEYKVTVERNVCQYALNNNLSSPNISKCLSGKSSHYKGYRFINYTDGIDIDYISKNIDEMIPINY